MRNNWIIWVVITVILISLFSNFNFPTNTNAIDYSEFVTQVKAGQVSRVSVDGLTISGEYTSGGTFETIRPAISDDNLMNDLVANNVQVVGVLPEERGILTQLLIATFPVIIFVLIFSYLMRQQAGGGGKNNPFNFGKSRAKKIMEKDLDITFNDVAGVDEAKQELEEIVEFLKMPDKFHEVGGKIPKGVLMSGAPGTGKTLLARATAGEAKVPFFYMSGSDFVEMFVGVGASRVRDLFEQARKNAPCIIFIDEIDAVGRQRGTGLGGGHDEREQTLNQILVEMDGFDSKLGIIVIAATNRADVLDPALLRPGRFDRQVMVDLPDINGRVAILEVHTKKITLDSNVNLHDIAKGTPGFSGADLANLVNEASLITVRENLKKVNMICLEKARDKIIMGPERKSIMMDDKEKLNTANHEAGHAIIGFLMPGHDKVYKVSIIPRGRALGITTFLPEKDKYSHSKETLLSSICTLFGGRIAEELINGEDNITTGAQNDIERASHIARMMVTKWGFSRDLGPINYHDQDKEVFLGKSFAHHGFEVSQTTAQKVDEEVKYIITQCYERSRKILTDNIDKLHIMAEMLMSHETIDSEQVKAVMDGTLKAEDKDEKVELKEA